MLILIRFERKEGGRKKERKKETYNHIIYMYKY